MTEEDEAPLTGARVLVGEPHQGLRRELHTLLEAAGAEVCVVGDLDGLVDSAASWQPTVVVTAERYPAEVEDPGRTVVGAIALIHAREHPPSVVVYSSSDSLVLAATLTRAGAEQVRVKGVDPPEELLDDIADAHRFAPATHRR